MSMVFQMGNASDTSAVFASTISKEYDIFMGSLYSVFCKSTWNASLCSVHHLLTPNSISPSFYFFKYRRTVSHGQLRPATCCVSQAVDLEASRVLHHQSFYQRPWDDAVFIPTGSAISFFTQVRHVSLLLSSLLPSQHEVKSSVNSNLQLQTAIC